MIITNTLFGPEYRIEMDEYQYTVQKVQEYPKGVRWVPIGYYSSLKLAVSKLIKLKILNENDELSLQAYVDHYEDLLDKITTQLSI